MLLRTIVILAFCSQIAYQDCLAEKNSDVYSVEQMRELASNYLRWHEQGFAVGERTTENALIFKGYTAAQIDFATQEIRDCVDRLTLNEVVRRLAIIVILQPSTLYPHSVVLVGQSLYDACKEHMWDYWLRQRRGGIGFRKKTAGQVAALTIFTRPQT